MVTKVNMLKREAENDESIYESTYIFSNSNVCSGLTACNSTEEKKQTNPTSENNTEIKSDTSKTSKKNEETAPKKEKEPVEKPKGQDSAKPINRF